MYFIELLLGFSVNPSLCQHSFFYML
jgi:hypothetical protein